MRYCLIDGHGNFGSIDGDPPAHYRYCVTGDTLIGTNKGIMPIKELENEVVNEEDLKDIFVKNYKGNYVQATKFFNSGKHDILEIKLANGQEIKGTYNHPIMSLDKDLNYIWKRLDELKQGDVVLLPSIDYQYNDKKEFDLEAAALGALVSEGYITTQNRIGINNLDFDMIKVVSDWFSSLGYSGTATINKRKNSQIYEYCVSSKDIWDLLVTKYNYQKQAKNKIIPEKIMRKGSSSISCFLSYLFEGDGGVVVKNNHIFYSSYSKELVKQIQIILLQEFGIFSTINYSGKEYKLIISSFGLEKFQRAIDFVSIKKKNLLNTIINNFNNKKKIPQNSYYCNHFISNFVRNKNNNSFTQKHSFANKKNYFLAKPYLEKEDFDKIKNLIDNYIIIPVIEIKKLSEKEFVYSVKVEDKDSDHSFIANGFINHNTEAKMTKFAEEMVRDIKKNTVDFVPNFSEEYTEPEVLPARVPNLLLNGTTGI